MIKKLALAFLAIIVMASCGNRDEKQLKELANNYLTAFFKDVDMEKAKTFCTPESQEFLTAIASLIEMQGSEEMKENGAKMTFEVGTPIINGDEAEIPFTSNDGEKTNSDKLKAKKVDGKWLIHMTKENPAPQEEEVTEEPVDTTAVVAEEPSKKTNEKKVEKKNEEPTITAAKDQAGKKVNPVVTREKESKIKKASEDQASKPVNAQIKR